MISYLKNKLHIFLNLSACVLSAQVQEEWTHKVDGTNHTLDGPSSILFLDSDHIFISGYVTDTSTYEDFVILNYDETGILKWMKTSLNPGTDFATDMALDSDGSLYICGQIWNGDNFDFFVFKYTKEGEEVWQMKYNNPDDDNDRPRAIRVNTSNEIYVTGISKGDTTHDDILTVKLTAQGDTAWVRRFTGSESYSYEEPYDMILDDSGNVYITGFTAPGFSYGDVCLLKYDLSGQLKWTRTYSGSGDLFDVGVPLGTDKNGNIYVASRVDTVGGPEDYDFVILKYNPIGELLWKSTYGGDYPGSNDLIEKILIDSISNIRPLA